MSRKRKGHCWHYSGLSCAMTFGGESDMRCCYCGAYGVERWSIADKRIKGHGTRVTQSVHVRESIVTETEVCRA